MTNLALVFVRSTGAHGIGHVGWAFSYGDGTFNTGSVENPLHTLRTNPLAMGFWTMRTRDPIEAMRARKYDGYKVIELESGDIMYAWQVVGWVAQKPYDLFGENCMNATYDVLRAYGVVHLPAPAHHWEPNHWFHHVSGTYYHIDADGVDLNGEHASAPVASAIMPDLDSLITSTPDYLTPSVPPWRIPGTAEERALQAAIAAAPPMPVSSRHRSAASRTLLGMMRRLFHL